MAGDAELIGLFAQAALEVGNHQFDNLSMDTEIADLGIDSVELLEIFGEIEEELDVQLADEDLAEIVSLRDLAELIRSQS